MTAERLPAARCPHGVRNPHPCRECEDGSSAPVGVEGLVASLRSWAEIERGLLQGYAAICINRCADKIEALAQQPAADLAWCALDRDECTVTLAFDTEEQVNEFIANRPSRKRARGSGDGEDAGALLAEIELPHGFSVVEHLPGIWEYRYQEEDGTEMVGSTSWSHPALAAIDAWQWYSLQLAGSER